MRFPVRRSGAVTSIILFLVGMREHFEAGKLSYFDV
jgi:hypothetical protein